ncbi:MAG TPA: phosphatase PAP2 family protein, partial [Flavobacteriaceae bacterium]|nr:phosphatase PAP2 family protein [Flavobacteriaceae bacterium]
MEELLDYDKDLFLYLNSLGSEQWDILWLTITNKWMSIPIYILLLV